MFLLLVFNQSQGFKKRIIVGLSAPCAKSPLNVVAASTLTTYCEVESGDSVFGLRVTGLKLRIACWPVLGNRLGGGVTVIFLLFFSHCGSCTNVPELKEHCTYVHEDVPARSHG